jgi:hypothetical protein
MEGDLSEPERSRAQQIARDAIRRLGAAGIHAFDRDSAFAELGRVFITFGEPKAHWDSQGNCASRRAMASAAVSPGVAGIALAAGGVGIWARRSRWLRP